MLVQSVLENSARRSPDKTALVCGTKRFTYAELETRANHLAWKLLAAGIARGDRVAVHLENSPEAVVAIFAILKAGAVFLLVNPTVKPDKLAYLLNDCRAKGLITDASKAERLHARWEQVPWVSKVWVAGQEMPRVGGKRFVELDAVLAGSEPWPPPASKNIDMDLAALAYTSGSTGKPKGVMLTHLNLVSATVSIHTYLENTADDIILNVLPLSFGYGLSQLLTAFYAGARLVLERSFTYPFSVIEKLIQENVTAFPMVPTIAAILLQMDLAKYGFPDLRYITTAGAALPPSHILRLRALLPHVKIYAMYGQTECTRITYLPPEQAEIRPASVGRGMPNEEVYIVDEQGNRVGPGVIGELVVRGSHVMRGYWEAPEATEKALRPGLLPGERVLWTGDLFRRDEEGYLYFVSRKDDIIKTRGEKVSPKEVEDVLYGMEGVAEAVVVGVPDPVLGQAVQAHVTIREGARRTEQEILRYCAQHLEDFMVPKSVVIRDSIPKTANGKNDRRELAALAGARP